MYEQDFRTRLQADFLRQVFRAIAQLKRRRFRVP
jgi:hypothetical protein